MFSTVANPQRNGPMLSQSLYILIDSEFYSVLIFKSGVVMASR